MKSKLVACLLFSLFVVTIMLVGCKKIKMNISPKSSNTQSESDITIDDDDTYINETRIEYSEESE